MNSKPMNLFQRTLVHVPVDESYLQLLELRANAQMAGLKSMTPVLPEDVHILIGEIRRLQDLLRATEADATTAAQGAAEEIACLQDRLAQHE